eukprot:s2920_g7.t1
MTRELTARIWLDRSKTDGPYMVSVLYCELQAHQGDQALLVLYENESCEVALNSVVLNVDAILAEKERYCGHRWL